MFNKSTRSYFFRGLVALHKGPLSWREARLMFKGATAAAIAHAEDKAKMLRWAKEVERQERIDRALAKLGRYTKQDRKFVEDLFS